MFVNVSNHLHAGEFVALVGTLAWPPNGGSGVVLFLMDQVNSLFFFDYIKTFQLACYYDKSFRATYEWPES